MSSAQIFQAKIQAPFGVLGICCNESALIHIEFLSPKTELQAPVSKFAQEISRQLAEYFSNPDYIFTLPLALKGTAHQNKVWQAMCAIPRGHTRQYGELARELSSSARAVGQACGANPLPIVIPCHRIVSKVGMGGFANHSDGYEIDIKRWLLVHEAKQ
jgi:methylated-DNA-[protein]-cysteine S-methyltransferase